MAGLAGRPGAESPFLGMGMFRSAEALRSHR